MTLIVCCAKKRHKTAAPVLKGPALMWHNDGPSSAVSSATLLVKWLATGDDHNNCRGGLKQSGKTRSALLAPLVKHAQDEGIKLERNSQAIQTKINHLLQMRHVAKKWQNAAGRGVTCEASIRKAFMDRCVCFCDLDPVPHDRPFVTPLATSDHTGIMDNSSDISDDDEDDEDDDKEESPTLATPQRLRHLMQSLEVTKKKVLPRSQHQS